MAACQAIQIEKDQGRLFTVSVDSEFVYWGGDNAAIAKKKLDGSGLTKTLVPSGSQEYSYDSVLAGNTLFWGNDWHDTGVRGCVLPDCTDGPKPLISGGSDLISMAYDAKSNTLFWDQSDGIWRKALPAGNPSNFVPLTSKQVTAMTTDGIFLYWAEYDTSTKLTSLKKTLVGTLTLITLAVNLPIASSLTVHGNTLYFAQATTDATSDLRSVPLPNGVGSAAPPSFAPGDTTSPSIKADASGIYWTTRGGAADAIKTCPLTGCVGAPKILSPATDAWGITTDATAVYWVEETGRVMKVAK